MQLKKIRTPYILLGIFALAFILRLIYYAEVHNQLYFQALLFDAKSYDSWARRILTEGWLGKGIFFVSPLYAYFLAIIYKLGGNPTTVKFIQFGLGSLVPLFIYGIGVRLFSKRVAIIASLISCFYGGAIFFEGLLLKTTLEVFLVCASFFFLLLAKEKKLNSLWFLSGVMCGLSVLAKDTTLLFVPLVLAWIYLIKNSLPKSSRPFFFYLLGAFLIIGSLTIRNIAVGKDFVLTTYGAGMNFHMGNFKGADGALKEPDFIRIDPEYEEIDSLREAERRVGRKLKPSEASSFWLKETIKEIKGDPRRFIRLLLRKTGLLINRTGLSDNYQMAFFKRYSFFFKYILVGFWPLMVLGLSGIGLALWLSKRLKEQSLLLIFFFATSTLLILGHVIDRYREVLMPELILFSSYFLVQIYEAIKRKKNLVVASGAGAVFVFTILTSLHFPNFDQIPYADAYNQLGLLYQEKGDYESAVREYKNALGQREDHLWARQNLADIYLRLGRVEDAIREYKKSLRYRPDVLRVYVLLKKAMEMKGLSREEILKKLKEDEVERAEQDSSLEPEVVSYHLGLEYLMKKEYDKAIAQFQKVIDASPSNLNALINIGIAYRQKAKPEKAILSYKRALRVAPEIIPARYNLAMVLMSEKRFPEAIPHLEKIVSVFPEYMLAQYYLAQGYEETGQIKKAIEEYKNLITWTGDDPKRSQLADQARDKVWFLEKQIKKVKQEQVQDMPFEGAGYD